MIIIEIKDKYNENKVWAIKHTPCRHYYINQKICGKMIYSKFQKVSKKFINAIVNDITGFYITVL